MPVRIPGAKPRIENDPLDQFFDGMIDALEDIPIRILMSIIGIVPIVGQPIANALGNWLLDTNDKAVSANTKSDNIATNINNAVTGGSASGTGLVAGVFDAVANIFGTADSAQKIAMAAQQQLQQLTDETNQPGWSGYSWSSIFSGAAGSPLPSSDWTTTNIVIAGDDGHAGLVQNSPDGLHLAVLTATHQFATDSQSASIVVGNKLFGSDDLATSIRIRCNSSGTQGAVCWIRPENIRIGRFGGGTSTVWYTADRIINPGDIIRFRCHGDNYYVLVNGVTVISWTDVSGAVSKGAAYRSAAFGEEYLNGALYDQASFRVASWTMADWLPPGGTVTTPAWRLRRGVTTEVAQTVSSGMVAQLPSGFYTINDLASGVTVTNLGTGRVTVTESGWYEIAATMTTRRHPTDYPNAWVPTPWVLYVDGTPVAGPIMAGVTTTVYLAAGQIAQPGISASWPVRGNDSSTTSALVNDISGGPAASFTGRKVA